MRKFLICLIAAGLFHAPVWAQEGPRRAEDIVAKMQEKLNLTQDQVEAVTPIIAKYFPKQQELKQDMRAANSDKQVLHAQMRQLRADEKKELSQVLSSQQLALWDKMRQAKHKLPSPQSAGNN